MIIGDIIIDAWGSTGIIVGIGSEGGCGYIIDLPNVLVRYDGDANHPPGDEVCMMQKHLTVTGYSEPVPHELPVVPADPNGDSMWLWLGAGLIGLYLYLKE